MNYLSLAHVRYDPATDRWIAVIRSRAGHVADVYGDDEAQARQRGTAIIFATRRPAVWALLRSVFQNPP